MSFADLLLAVVINAVWGLNFVAVKWAVADFPPLVANTIRFLSVVILLIPYLKVIPGQMKGIARVAVILGVFHFGTIFYAMAIAEDIAPVAIVAQLGVPFSTILAAIMLKEAIGWRRAMGVALSFAGVLIMGFDPRVFNDLDAVVWMAVAAFLFALAAIYMRRIRDVPAMTTQAWVGIAGIAGSLSLSLLFETGQVDAVRQAGWLAWGAVLYSGIMSSIVGHGGMNYLLRKYEVAVVTPYFLTTPLFAVLGGVLLLDETLGGRTIVGAAVTLVGVGIVNLRMAKRKQLPPAARIGDAP